MFVWLLLPLYRCQAEVVQQRFATVASGLQDASGVGIDLGTVVPKTAPVARRRSILGAVDSAVEQALVNVLSEPGAAQKLTVQARKRDNAAAAEAATQVRHPFPRH
jgi:hypothetical protein